MNTSAALLTGIVVFALVFLGVVWNRHRDTVHVQLSPGQPMVEVQGDENVIVVVGPDSFHALLRYEDPEAGTVCYRIKNLDGLDCMRKVETTLP